MKMLLTMVATLISTSSYALGSTPMEPHWQQAKPGAHQIPNQAFIATQTPKQTIHICTAPFLGGYHPGMLTKAGCTITFGGETKTLSIYRTLMGDNKHLFWDKDNNYSYYNRPHMSQQLPGLPLPTTFQQKLPVLGGYETNMTLARYHRSSYNDIYICRGMFHNQIHIGKVISSHCNIAWNHKEVMLDTYQTLYYSPKAITSPYEDQSIVTIDSPQVVRPS